MSKTVVINGETLGSGSEELGERLMGSFLRTLGSLDDKPDTIILYNSGVKLAGEGSSVLDALDALFKAGVDILSCGTCVGYYGLNDKIVVGRVSNMGEIAPTLLKSDNVITV